MQKIENQTALTPSMAVFAEVSSIQNGVYTVEYYKANQELIPMVPIRQRLMTEETYKKLVGKENAADADPRQSDRADTDVEFGRSSDMDSDVKVGLKAKRAVIKRAEKDDTKPDQKVTKQATLPKHVTTGKGAFAEANDHSTYTWQAIVQAAFEAGLLEDQVRDLQRELDGNEFSESAQKKSL